MPVVSVNLDDEAFQIYKLWRDTGRSASRKVSSAIRRMWAGEDAVAALQPGDVRRSITGDILVWSGTQFEVKEE